MASNMNKTAKVLAIEPARIYIHDDLDALSAGVSQAWKALKDKH